MNTRFDGQLGVCCNPKKSSFSTAKRKHKILLLLVLLLLLHRSSWCNAQAATQRVMESIGILMKAQTMKSAKMKSRHRCFFVEATLTTWVTQHRFGVSTRSPLMLQDQLIKRATTALQLHCRLRSRKQKLKSASVRLNEKVFN